jgi:7-cyano-7-deazaguanine tRNA-ribosyltransferase
MAKTSFEVKHRDGLARIGSFSTPHGTVTTPTLLPVINPSILQVSVDTMKKIGAEMIITNSYIIHNNERLKEQALEKGVHSLVGDIPIMTDSGTFQMYVYGKVKVTNEEIINFQRTIGSDVGTILDVFTIPSTPHDVAEKEAAETLERARAGVDLKGDMALAGPVQGGVHPDLREWHARELSKLDLDFHPVGGVVPLMENGWYRQLSEVIIGAKKGLIPSRPVHLFGAGHPMIFPLAAYFGCDFFDSASYVKFAKDDRMMFWNGTKRLADINELWCPCPVCSGITIGELRGLSKQERVEKLSLHNLHVSFSEIKRIRDAIKYGDLRELVEARLRENPNLLPVLKVMKDHASYLEQFEPVTRRSAFYFTGQGSFNRPNLIRFKNRVSTRYMPSRRNDSRVMVLLDEGEKPYSRAHAGTIQQVREIADTQFFVNSIFGPVPLELDEMYPIAQTVIPNVLDGRTRMLMAKEMETFSHSLPGGLGLVWDGENTLEALRMVTGKQRGEQHGEQREGEHREQREGGHGEQMINKDISDESTPPSEDSEKVNADRSAPRTADNYDGRDMRTRLVERVRAVVDMQFGEGAHRMLDGDVKIRTSRKTGKIRNVLVDGDHVLSMRAHDGLFTLKPIGAKRLMELFPAPCLRATVDDEVAEYLREGRNAFAKFTLDMDPELRPMDEVIVVNSLDEFLAIGQVILVRDEALAFERGISVKVRVGADSGKGDEGPENGDD